MQPFIKKIFVVLIVLLTLRSSGQHNVIIIIADDLGTDYCGFYEDHKDTAPMPNVRSLLPTGIRFSNAWATPYCSSTRAGLLTGRYSFRTGVGTAIGGAGYGQLDTQEISIAKLLKLFAPVKYATADVGKWHLNNQTPQTQNYPSKFGYDYYAGNFLGSLTNYFSWNKITNGVNAPCTNYATSETVNDAIAWVGAQTTKPFFLWLGFNAPHSPYHLPPDSLHSFHTLSGTSQDIAQNPKAYFKAMTEAMDHEIGRLFVYLKANNKWDSTDIIFIGDNGNATRVAQNADTSRAKGTIYQCGVNVPFIISGPTVKSGGRVSTALVSTPDLFATILELAGYKNWQLPIPISKPIDSKSLLPIVLNQSNKVRDWNFTEVFSPTPVASDGKAIRNIDFKLLDFDDGHQEFYNLTNDPNELSDILKRTLTSTESVNYLFLCGEMGKLLGKTICEAGVGMNMYSTNSKPVVSPNPTSGSIHVTFNGENTFQYKIYSIDGKLLQEGNSLGEINASELLNGIYYLEINRQGSVWRERVFVGR